MSLPFQFQVFVYFIIWGDPCFVVKKMLESRAKERKKSKWQGMSEKKFFNLCKNVTLICTLRALPRTLS